MSLLDPFIMQIDQALRTMFAKAPSARLIPGEKLVEGEMSETERRCAAALMRVNHVGEVCAQALYASQSLSAGDSYVRQSLEQAAWEETEHLNWTERRILELGGRKSLLNPFWYAGAWTIGAIAGRFGDPVSLGFLVETERQVEAHLEGHLDRLPREDRRSRAVVEQMKTDEAAHAETAVKLGAIELPAAVKTAMRMTARIMTRTAYWV
ncbi:MAG: 2-polyprenyl-3-methyl-6-methoxy-1,4-benzoquinone monooxygenase [Pseudomonadota bacterium]